MEKKILVFLDGVCHLCAQEARFIDRAGDSDQVEFIDISDPSFDAEIWGARQEDLDRSLHVMLFPENKMVEGIDAVIAVWDHVPKFQWIATLLKRPVIYQLAYVGYRAFAWIRMRLPRRKTSIMCELKPPTSKTPAAKKLPT